MPIDWKTLRQFNIQDVYQDVWGSAGGRHINLGLIPKVFRHTSAGRALAFFRAQIFQGRIVNAFRRQLQPGLFVPKSIVIEPTFKCNLSCDRCYAPKRPVTMKRGVFETVVTQAEAVGVFEFVLMGGEPTLEEARQMYNPVIREHPRSFFGICTNATMVDDDYVRSYEGIDNIGLLLSIEGTRASTERRRGKGVYDRVLDGVRRIRAAGIPLALSVTLSAAHWREELSDEVVREFADAGGIVFYTHLIVDNQSPKQEEIDRVGLLLRLREICRKYTLFVTDGQLGKVSADGVVPRDFFQVCVDPDGNVRPFRFYYEPTIGSILDRPLREILADSGLIRLKSESRRRSNRELEDVAPALTEHGFGVFPHARATDSGGT